MIMKEQTALQLSDMGLGKSVTFIIIDRIMKWLSNLSLCLGHGLLSFNTHIIIQLTFESRRISPINDSLLRTLHLIGYLSDDILLDFKG